jgi:AGCS family alanine or glycine:cation symporter
VEQISETVGFVNGLVWGPPMLVLILGTGLYLSVGLGALPLRKLGFGFRMLWAGRHEQGQGDITPFNALMTSLSATIGTGNIAGVGTAIAIGGPGALFWMWMTALVGMATKYAEAVLAVGPCTTSAMGSGRTGPGWRPPSPSSACWPASASATPCRRTRWPTQWRASSRCPSTSPAA